MPEARGRNVNITCFVDANYAENVKDRRSQTGILIFVNKARSTGTANGKIQSRRVLLEPSFAQ